MSRPIIVGNTKYDNFAAARTIGIPIRIIPFSPFSPFWSLVDRKVALFLGRFPYIRQNAITRYNWRGWDIEDRWQSHYEMGDVFVLVTPQYNIVQPNNPQAITSSWKMQRRVATRCFNEANHEIVWSETLGLADDMLRYWSSRRYIKSSADDIRTLTLDVLARSGFGKSFKFRSHEEKKSADEVRSMSYRESVGLILENCIVILALGPKTLAFLARYWLPARLKTINNAVNSDNNLMTLLVRASQEAASEGLQGLTESEIYGDMFTFNFAGHDTTAHSSTFALYFLAANPDVQDWVSEEMQCRCLPVLYETLRLYTIVPAIKWTGDRATTLTAGNRTLDLPPKTILMPSYASMHTDPKYWGPDSLQQRPSRWIKPGLAGRPSHEEIDMNERGVILGWSEGTRDCPGKKFSQVEFVALMVGLFRRWRVDPVKHHPARAPLAWRKA
ncbi:putative cytochrome P450 [Hypoxylon cercidicola]|nr:putative cytochrome P450 [Hypoxylon cercidicola]